MHGKHDILFTPAVRSVGRSSATATIAQTLLVNSGHSVLHHGLRVTLITDGFAKDSLKSATPSGIWPKRERIGVRARRDPRIDFDWADVSDGRCGFHVPDAYRNNAERIETVAAYASKMSHDRMEGQKVVPELAVETEGLYNLIYDLADRYGARHMALQGQSAVGVRYELALRVANRWDQGIRTRVLCVADYDKHGDEILGAVAVDAAQHLRDMEIDPDQCLEVIRVVLTQRQIAEHGIPTAEKDGRLVQEAEALPTDVLRAEVEAALRDTLDMKLFDRIAKRKRPEIRRLIREINRLRVITQRRSG